jgi:hypothetical protein
LFVSPSFFSLTVFHYPLVSFFFLSYSLTCLFMIIYLFITMQ